MSALAHPRLRLLAPLAALAAVLLLVASLSAAKPDPHLTGAHANSQIIGGFCAVDVDVDWAEVKGPGSVTLELVGSNNPTNVPFHANDGGVTARLWPGGDAGDTFGQLSITVTRKNGRELFSDVADVAVTC